MHQTAPPPKKKNQKTKNPNKTNKQQNDKIPQKTCADVNVFDLCFAASGHHELPPVAHTTMLRDFPTTLQHSGEAVIPPRSSASTASPLSPASHYHQRYVSHNLK